MSIDLIEFATEFVNLARDFAIEFPGIKKQLFTSRQSIAISSLGTTRIIRKNEALAIKDLVELAVVTTTPEAQNFAEFVALRVIYGDESQYFSDQHFQTVPNQSDIQEKETINPEIDKQLTGQKILLEEILKLLNLSNSVNIQKDIQYHRFADEVEHELFSEKTPPKNSEMDKNSPDIEKDRNKNYPDLEDEPLSNEERLILARKRVSYEIIHGREGIIKNQLVDWDSTIAFAKKILITAIPSISNEELGQAQLLGCSDDVSALTREKYIHIIADLLVASGLENPKEIEQEIEEGLDFFTQYQLSRSYNIMQEYRGLLKRVKVREKYYANLLENIITAIKDRIIVEAKTMDDVLAHPDVFNKNEWTREKLKQFYENSKKYNDATDMMEKVLKFDSTFQTNISDLMEDDLESFIQNIPFGDFIQKPVPSPQWIDALDQYLQNMNLQNMNWQNISNIHNQMHDASSQVNSSIARKRIKQNMQESIQNMVNASIDYDQLSESVEAAKSQGLNLQNRDIKKKGEELNLTKQEIAQLLGDFMNYLETMIEDNEAIFERVDNILQNQQLNSQQFDKLMEKAIKHNSEGTLGALANRDLQKVANRLNSQPNGEELLQAALGAGGGENLLKEWFRIGGSLPPAARKIVKEAAKRVMIDLAKAKALALIGSSEAGPLPEGTTRPYNLGDDADTIDLDESLDNILALGKNLKDIEAEDFIVRKTVSGRRAVIFLIDISGSMSGAPLASASLAAAMLLFAFSRDELGLALFESNTHVLCEINKPIEIDEVVDEVLDLRAQGGTQMQQAVQWAERQLLESKSHDKMLVMLTDAMIGDFGRSEGHLTAIADMGTTSVLIMPQTARGVGAIQGILSRANAQLVQVDRWENFPEVVSEVLSRV